METKNEPKTLEEANYHEEEKPHNFCGGCFFSDEFDLPTGQGACTKFNAAIKAWGVCDCYE